eukprot:CAMPEP_0194526052 /NCGR_PEP_ID=MMETSP0253-20130528/61741_1 /TAXON_ID=2966 /ORGANISM="Noctiluca scintillans" /LENGTH=117 /DNA_ID=CAMNT_0039370843 /DNA_START=549 /DNA_END=903 /DNA_ORIENTATION=-
MPYDHLPLVREGRAEDTLPASTVESGEVSTLQHEAWYHTVEHASLEVKRHASTPNTTLPRAKTSEILSRCGTGSRKQLHLNATSVLTTNVHVEEDSWVLWEDASSTDTEGPLKKLLK